MDPIERAALDALGIVPEVDTERERGSQQAALPHVWPLPESARPVAFAHPAESDLAAILDRYGVRWAYEPTSFALEFGDDGRPSEMFTPDFYLPDERHYLELTTMRQRLVTRKNRKLRLLRDLYPDLRIKLLYRRDYHQLIDCHLDRPPVGFTPRLAGLVADADAIAVRLRAIAAEIAASELVARDVRPPLAVVADRGAFVFARDLRDCLESFGVRLDWDAVDEIGEGGGATLRLRQRPAGAVRGRRTLVIASVVSSGLASWQVTQWLARAGAIDSGICALLDRSEARIVNVPLRHAGWTVRGDLVVGYGLRLRREYAALPELRSMTWHADEA